MRFLFLLDSILIITWLTKEGPGTSKITERPELSTIHVYRLGHGAMQRRGALQRRADCGAGMRDTLCPIDVAVMY